VVDCAVAAYATQRATAEAIPRLRQRPAPLTGEPFPTSFLKHVDDQTVVGLAAVVDAIERHQLDPTSFRDWGVIAAPRFLGRVALASALNRFGLEGAWGISPHLIPHRSLHSVSGTVSQALKIQGPNIGVGGGPHAAAEALIVAGGMVADDRLPGIWVVMTGYDPECTPDNAADGSAQPGSVPVVGAVALALLREETRTCRLRLHISWGAVQPDAFDPAKTSASWPMFTLNALLEALSDEQTASVTGWRLRNGWAALEAVK